MRPTMDKPTRVLLLLSDLAKCRLSGDAFQGGMVELELELVQLDAEGGYHRPKRVEGPVPLTIEQRRYRASRGASQ